MSLFTYYDRKGNVIDRDRWTHLYADMEYRVVAKERVGKFFISTVWLGIDYQFGQGNPLFFETMAFDEDRADWSDVYMNRYSNEVAALAGHDQAVAMARDEMFK